jgi:uncharacterized protein YndB with AHSA1/START domain
MKQIKTEILINADAEKVWRILTDFEKYSIWNPFIKSISDDQFVGGKLTVSIHPPNGNAMTFKPMVL